MKNLTKEAKNIIKLAEEAIELLDAKGAHASIEDVESFLSIPKIVFRFDKAHRAYRKFVKAHYNAMKATA